MKYKKNKKEVRSGIFFLCKKGNLSNIVILLFTQKGTIGLSYYYFVILAGDFAILFVFGA
jgi:hypothetical protein